MKELTKLFVDWAKERKRWPLLIMLAIPSAFAAVQKYFDLSFHDTVNHWVFWLSIGLTVCVSSVLYIYVAHRKRILYSATLDRIRGGQRVIITDSVAWQAFSYTSSGETRSSTLADEAAALLSRLGLPDRVVVIKQKKWDKRTYSERCRFFIEGVSEGSGVVLKAQMVISKQAVERLIEQLTKPVELADQSYNRQRLLFMIPAERFFRNQFLFSQFMVEVPLTTNTSIEDRATVTRLILRYVLGMSLFYDADSKAGRLFQESIAVGKLLASSTNPALAGIFKTIGYYFGIHKQKTEEAIEALGLAGSFDPSDKEIAVMRIYLLLVLGRISQAGESLEGLSPFLDDPALVYELQGEYFIASRQHIKAIRAYESALKNEDDNYYRSRLNLAIAVAYGMTDDISAVIRSSEMIKYLEDSIQIGPEQSILHSLQGFAWALQNNSEMSRRAFERAYSLAVLEGGAQQLDYYSYWLARSFFQLRQSPEAISELERVVGAPHECEDPHLLEIFGQNLLNIPGRETDAEMYLDKAIELSPDLGKAYRYKGIAVSKRFINATESDVAHRLQINEEARTFLRKAIDLGEESGSVHSLLALLYREAGDSVNAERHYLRALELDPENENHLIALAEIQVEFDRLEEARISIAKALQLQPESAEIRLQEGLIWQKVGSHTEAERAYTEGLRIDPSSSSAHNNLAFVLFDMERFDEALGHWEEALNLAPNHADVLAGRAIALETLGRNSEALDSYKAAIEQNNDFLDTKILQESYMWSEAAIKAVEPLIKELRMLNES